MTIPRRLLAVNFLLLLGLLGASFPRENVPARADIVFRNATVENLYPKEVLFRVEICGRSSTSHVIFNYVEYRSGTWAKEIRTLDDGQTPDGCYKQKYFLETQNLYIPPFFQINYFWSVTEGTKVISQSFKYVYTYKNAGYPWKNLEDEHFVIWWHDRPDSFGREVMSVATLAFHDQAKFYSSSLKSPIIIVITNTPEEFFAWQPKKNSMSGMAFAKISLTVQLVEENADYSDWLHDVIPHEISHIYFGHLVRDDTGIPRWINEGLATYMEYSDHWGRWMTLKSAHDTGKTLPLKDLEDDFGEDPERIQLAYAESYYAILYMDEVYGRDAIAALLNEYRKGTSTAAAFEKSFGKDPESFERDFMVWLAERLKTPPPNTQLPRFASRNANVLVYFLAGMLCLGGLLVMMAGTILMVILKARRNNRTKEISEIEPLVK